MRFRGVGEGKLAVDGHLELASLGRTLQFAIFAVQASEENRYSAQLTLRFAPTGTR